MLILIALLTTVVVAAYFYYKKCYSYWERLGVPQGSMLSNLIDHWRFLLGIDHVSTRENNVYVEYPEAKYVGYYQFSKPSLLLKDPELIKQIMIKDFDHFVDRQLLIGLQEDPLWKRNLVILEGEEWRETRVILSPSFTAAKMKEMFILVKECAKHYSNYLLEKNEKLLEFEMLNFLGKYTNDVIASCAFGIKVDSITNPQNSFYLHGLKAMKFDIVRVLKMLFYVLAPKIYNLFKFTFFPKSVRDFFYEVTQDVIKVREEKSIVRPDVINLLMQARKTLKNKKSSIQITDFDITTHAFLFFAGGFDTVQSITTFLMYELAVNPDVQRKLKEEIEETSQLCNGELTYDVLMQMKYMDMVVSECLRKWTPMPQIVRKCTKPYTLEPPYPGAKPVKIPKDTLLMIPLVSIHRNPDHFPDPLKFDPERFSDDNKNKFNQYAYLPFGAGPRNCIGNRFSLMDIKTFVYYFLLNFEIVPVEKTNIKPRIYPKSFSLKPEGGMVIGFKRRS